MFPKRRAHDSCNDIRRSFLSLTQAAQFKLKKKTWFFAHALYEANINVACLFLKKLLMVEKYHHTKLSGLAELGDGLMLYLLIYGCCLKCCSACKVRLPSLVFPLQILDQD